MKLHLIQRLITLIIDMKNLKIEVSLNYNPEKNLRHQQEKYSKKDFLMKIHFGKERMMIVLEVLIQ